MSTKSMSDVSYDKEVKSTAQERYWKGPYRTRKCTDIFCFLIWIVFWGVIIYFAIYGYAKGDLNNIA